MKFACSLLAACLTLGLVRGLTAAEPDSGENPAEHLPPQISRVTWFGERADWSHDGKRILFLSKTFGDAMEIDLVTKKVTNYSNAPGQYDEPEGIFPDGEHTLVECDKQNHMGSGHVDLWKLALDGSGSYERLTYFSDSPGFKASNAVVSDDGRFIAFQLAKSREAAGVGHGIFVLNLDKAPVPR